MQKILTENPPTQKAHLERTEQFILKGNLLRDKRSQPVPRTIKALRNHRK